MRLFRDRVEAGQRLAEHLARRMPERGSDVVVFGIPRGGVIVARPVADALGAALDIVIPRKVGAPENAEMAVAAVALAGGEQIVVRDEPTLAYFQVPDDYVEREAARQRHEIARRQAAYRRGRAPVPVAGRVAVLVDDGLATGLTARAAVQALTRQGPRRTLVAVPVAPPEAVSALEREGVQVEVLEIPSPFRAVGRFYDSFDPVEDEAVVAALNTRTE